MPEISRITLPSGSTYDLKDATAREMIAAGMSFIIAWNGNSAPTVANIPAGVVVTYNNTKYTGTLTVIDAAPGAFYLVKSSTTPSSEVFDGYDEYIVIKPDTSDNTTWFWEKVGDTKIDLTDVVTGVTLNKQTDTVIGTDSTFKITQPTVSLATGATAGTGVISVATGITSATASGDNVTALTGLGTPSTATVLKGVKVTAQPTIAMALADSSATGKVAVITEVGASKTNIKATASGGAASFNSKDSKTVVTGLGTPSTKSAIGANSTFTVTQPTIALATGAEAGDGVIAVATGVNKTTKYVKASATSANTAWNSKDSKTVVTGYASPGSDTFLKSISSTSKKLKTTSITGVSGSTTASKVTRTAQTTATGATTASSDNTKILANVSVSNETLTIGAVTLNTQTTGSVSTPTDVTVPVAASATTVATGKVADSDTNGDTIVTAASGGTSASALTGLGDPSTATVVGTSSTFTVTQPTITLALDTSSATGRVGVLTDTSATTTNISASASGANTAWNSKDAVSAVTGYSSPTTATVVGTSATLSNTQPTITLTTGATAGAGVIEVATDATSTIKYIGGTASGTAVGADGTASAVTGYASPTTDTVLGTASTITVTPTTTNIKATASGAKTEWNSKDSVTVLTNNSTLTVEKGQ